MVRIKTFPSMETKCAGTLITLQHVLTTSDCICGTPERTKIMTGTDEEPGCRSRIHDVAQFIPYDGDYSTSSHLAIVVVSIFKFSSLLYLSPQIFSVEFMNQYKTISYFVFGI